MRFKNKKKKKQEEKKTKYRSYKKRRRIFYVTFFFTFDILLTHAHTHNKQTERITTTKTTREKIK